MFEIRRNHMIVTVLVFMIAIAAYLSFTETPSSVSPQITNAKTNQEEITVTELPVDKDFFENTIETLPPDTDVNMPLKEETAEVAAMGEGSDLHNIEQMQNVDVTITKKESLDSASSNLDQISESANKNVAVSYFLEEKMLREQSRAAQVEQLTEYVANESLDKDSKAKAAENLLLIQERIEKESGAESLLRAKGFKDVFVRMDNDTVDVVVNKTQLTDEEIAQIEEIVHRKTGYSVGKIKITPLNIESGVSQN